VATTLVLLALVIGGVIFSVVTLTSTPENLVFTAPAGQGVNITMQTVGSFGSGIHSSWVSYMMKSPDGHWVHSTMFQVPEKTRVNVTIYNYDSGSPLRNQQIGMVQGTAGGVATLNGRPFNIINSNAGNGVGHTFSIPTLGINVPLYGNNGNANLCGVAPCTTSSPHQIIRFSFTSPGPGNYPWQCFVPCAAGWLYGNGGPMQTVGWMDGFMQVVA